MGVKPVMVTGDNWRAARAVAKEDISPSFFAGVYCGGLLTLAIQIRVLSDNLKFTMDINSCHTTAQRKLSCRNWRNLHKRSESVRQKRWNEMLLHIGGNVEEVIC